MKDGGVSIVILSPSYTCSSTGNLIHIKLSWFTRKIYCDNGLNKSTLVLLKHQQCSKLRAMYVYSHSLTCTYVIYKEHNYPLSVMFTV